MLAGSIKGGIHALTGIKHHLLVMLFLIYVVVFLVTGIVVYTVYR